jgi:RNA polymerase sigma-70 factor (ECF subfamily)
MDMTDPRVPGLRADTREQRDRAWSELYDAQFVRIYHLACRFGVREHDAEDVVQRIFEVAHRRIHEVENVQNLGAWIRGIAVRVVADYHKWWRVRAVKEWLLRSTSEDDRRIDPDPELSASARQTQMRVGETLNRMSSKLREVLVLLDIEQCTPSEVAEVLDIPVNTVRSRARLAREQFRQIWGERFES